jgi:hypothetical protein
MEEMKLTYYVLSNAHLELTKTC